MKSDKDFDYYMFDHIKKSQNNNQINVGYGWAQNTCRWCTGLLKRNVINKYLKEIRNEYKITQCIGIAFDEGYRLIRKHNTNDIYRHPLAEWGWTEDMSLQYCNCNGYDWEGLYKIFNRVSCWCCPFKTLNENRNLYTMFPNLWQELKYMDHRAWNNYTANYTVDDLEKRFIFEKERKRLGKSITNREFYIELKQLFK